MTEQRPFERIRIRASEEEAERFFARLEQEAENLPFIHAKFGHHIIRFRFPDHETAERCRVFLDLVCTEYEGEPDGTISVWQGKAEDYLNLPCKPDGITSWEYSGGTGMIRFAQWQGRLLADHFKSNRHYIIVNGPMDEYMSFWATFRWSLHNFAMRHGYALVHSAAVGLNGEGILISATGGHGKSTTALSCLLDGFDYVSDDYLILEKETAVAYPLFNCGFLNEDSLQRLPELRPRISGPVPRRPGRYIIDLSKFREQFCHGMIIKAIVHPRILSAGGSEREALIREDPLHTGRTQLLVSSAGQNGLGMMRDQDDLHWMFGAVSRFPTYELLLSSDRQSNCRALRELIGSLAETK